MPRISLFQPEYATTSSRIVFWFKGPALERIAGWRCPAASTHSGGTRADSAPDSWLRPLRGSTGRRGVLGRSPSFERRLWRRCGMSDDEVAALTLYPEADGVARFSGLERLVLDYATAMTRGPKRHTRLGAVTASSAARGSGRGVDTRHRDREPPVAAQPHPRDRIRAENDLRSSETGPRFSLSASRKAIPDKTQSCMACTLLGCTGASRSTTC